MSRETQVCRTVQGREWRDRCSTHKTSRANQKEQNRLNMPFPTRENVPQLIPPPRMVKRHANKKHNTICVCRACPFLHMSFLLQSAKKHGRTNPSLTRR